MEKINYDLNIFSKTQNFILQKYRNLKSRILYKSCYFLDSNFLIPKNDKRFQIFKNKNRQFFATEHIFNEINKKDTNWQKILPANNLKIINFDDLRIKFPATCPVYYNYIKSMHNPANICSPDFFINKNFAVKEKGKFNDERKNFPSRRSLLSRDCGEKEHKTNLHFAAVL